MKIRFVLVLTGIALLFLFSCQKELSLEPGSEGGSPTPAGDFRAMIDGTPWSADNTKGASVLGGIINIIGVSSDNKMLSITLVGSTAGTYPVNQNTPNFASYNEIANGAITVSFSTNQSNDTSKAGGVVTITEIDVLNKTISGSFYFNGYDPGDSARKVVSAGVFTKLSYTTTLPPANTTDTFSVNIDGANWTAKSIVADAVSGQLYIAGSEEDGSKSVGLYMPVDVSPGTYILDFTGATYVGQYSPSPTTTLFSQGIGSVTILDNNSSSRRIKGNFNFKASDVVTNQSAQLDSGYFSVGY